LPTTDKDIFLQIAMRDAVLAFLSNLLGFIALFGVEKRTVKKRRKALFYLL
jgi:hypothetical protein